MSIIDIIVIVAVIAIAVWFLVKGYPNTVGQIHNFAP